MYSQEISQERTTTRIEDFKDHIAYGPNKGWVRNPVYLGSNRSKKQPDSRSIPISRKEKVCRKKVYI